MIVRRTARSSSALLRSLARVAATARLLLAQAESVPFNLKPKDTIQTLVVIQNKNIGHSLIPDLYEAWVEFTVKQSDGAEIYHSGFLRPDGALDPRAHSFINRPVDENGVFVDNHRVFAIHSVGGSSTMWRNSNTDPSAWVFTCAV